MNVIWIMLFLIAYAAVVASTYDRTVRIWIVVRNSVKTELKWVLHRARRRLNR